MALLLADSNALRHPDLQAYLGASRDHHLVLSDLTLIEMRKTNPVSTSRESLQIIGRFPNQVFLLKRTFEILELNIASARDVDALFDHGAGVELDRIYAALMAFPPSDWLKDRMAELEAEAVYLITELGRQMVGLEDALVSATREFTRPQIKELRTGVDVSEATQETLFRLLKETTAQFFLDNHARREGKGILVSKARGMFGFRYSLCMMIYYIVWVQQGRQTGKKPHLRVNDVVDMQLAALGTYFNGVLSRDDLVRDTSQAVRALLRRFGAYVGEDWGVPASLS